MTAVGDAVPIEEQWADLVTGALLGTDRRSPPDPTPPLADLVADTAASAPSERMLAQVAACAAVRRAAFLPGDPLPTLAAPPDDDRPPCPPAAVARWHHVTTSWPVLEDEWIVLVVQNGWRVAPELVPPLLLRHRSDGPRRSRVFVASGGVAAWLVEHLPDLGRAPRASAGVLETVLELPPLPIPAELLPFLDAPGAESGAAIAGGLATGALGHAHRNVLVNLIGRVLPEALADIARHLDRIDPSSPGHPTAHALADLALTRRRMIDELAAPGDSPSTTDTDSP